MNEISITIDAAYFGEPKEGHSPDILPHQIAYAI